MHKSIIGRLVNYYRLSFWATERYAKYLGVKIGKNCNIQDVSFGSEPYLVEIGNHVQITAGTKIFTHGGGWVFRDKYPNFDYFGKVVIKDNVYIGNNCLIMPGVTIGSNVIIGAGSVVTKSVSDGKIVAGNPAKIIGETNELLERLLPFNINSKGLTYLEKKNLLLSLSNDNPECLIKK